MKFLYSVLLIAFCFLLWQPTVQAQPSNDECQTAIQLTEVENWCSNFAQFTNIGATDGTQNGTPYMPPDCFTNLSNDVWFVFTPIAKDVVVSINGDSGGAGNGGTLIGPEVALYGGLCGGILEELECQADNADDFVEMSQSGLILGQSYYIRVEGLGDRTGTFELCIRNFNPPTDPASDCVEAAILCDKSSFTVQKLLGAGDDDTEIADASCFENGVSALGNEMNSTWFKWTCETSGSLTFVLSPIRVDEDLDFVLFELPGGLDDCANKQAIRCMAAGDDPIDYTPTSPCHGPTGLNLTEIDIAENAGCDENQNSFLSAVGMTAGMSYALIVNNFTPGDGGFTIEFGGTGTFVGPQPAFTIAPDTVKCLEDVTFTDASTYAIGNIVGWEWSFGQEADPPTAITPGPHTVNYGSVGTKSIALTVESDEGCIVTTVIQYEVLPCCGNPIPDNLGVNIVNQSDPVCAGDSTGVVTIIGVDGTPFYQYSEDGDFYQGGQTFSNLPAGDYTFFVRDKLGCEEAIDITISEPPPIVVDAGPDQTVDLGNEANLNANYSPQSPSNIITWNPDSLMSCMDCLNPMVLPAGTTTYTLTVMDPAGCMDTDSVTIFVSENRPLFIPNVFSPNFDGINDIFTIYGSPAVDRVALLRVFDRWGNMLYEGTDLSGQDPTEGWDGTFRNKNMQQGVYTFYADVLFVDNVNIIYEGDITLMGTVTER